MANCWSGGGHDNVRVGVGQPSVDLFTVILEPLVDRLSDVFNSSVTGMKMMVVHVV